MPTEVSRRFLRPAALIVRLHNPSLIPELVRHFERSGFSVQRRGNALDVDRPDAPTKAQAEREVQAHLDVWVLMYPDSVADVQQRHRQATTGDQEHAGRSTASAELRGYGRLNDHHEVKRPDLREEVGIALVMALGITVVLIIFVASMISYTSENSRNTNNSNSRLGALALASQALHPLSQY